MCKFTKPTIPADATADERRSLMFDAMYNADLSEEVEKKNGMSYVSWSQTWKCFKEFCPSANYKIFTNPNTGLPVFESEMGLMVHTAVEADGLTYEDWNPVLDFSNRAMKSVGYTVSVYNKQTHLYEEKQVAPATSFDINSSIQRSLCRAIARHGLALKLWSSGEFNEEQTDQNNGRQNGYQQKNNGGYQRQQYNGNRQQYNNNRPAQPQVQQQVVQPQPQAPALDQTAAALKAQINATTDVPSLISIYTNNIQIIESNAELKSLLTNRKKALQSLNAA